MPQPPIQDQPPTPSESHTDTGSSGHGGDQPADGPPSWCVSFTLKWVVSHSWQESPVATRGPRGRPSPSLGGDTVLQRPPSRPPANSHRSNGNPHRSLSDRGFLTFPPPADRPAVLGNDRGDQQPPRRPDPGDGDTPNSVHSPNSDVTEDEEANCLLAALLKCCPCLELATFLKWCPCLKKRQPEVLFFTLWNTTWVFNVQHLSNQGRGSHQSLSHEEHLGSQRHQRSQTTVVDESGVWHGDQRNARSISSVPPPEQYTDDPY